MTYTATISQYPESLTLNGFCSESEDVEGNWAKCNMQLSQFKVVV